MPPCLPLRLMKVACLKFHILPVPPSLFCCQQCFEHTVSVLHYVPFCWIASLTKACCDDQQHKDCLTKSSTFLLLAP